MAPNDTDYTYTVQAINAQYWQDQCRRVVGRKVGLTATAVKAQFGVIQPDFRVLVDDMEIGDGGTLPASRLIQPKAEAEIALILGADLVDPTIMRADVEASVASVCAALDFVQNVKLECP